MNINNRLTLSYYKHIATINESHQIYLVQHQSTHGIYIKKAVDIYCKPVYEHLMKQPIPSTPKIVELIDDEDKLIVIEEYISGDTLEKQLSSGRHFSDDEIHTIISKLCDILHNLHSQNPAIIHRDIKPSNIIVSESLDVYLIDFGASKQHSPENAKNKDTVLLGTKGYAAPEQYGFGASSPQTDIYALGMLINTLVNGYFSESLVENHRYSDIISKCTKLDSSQRYSNVLALKNAMSGDAAQSSIEKNSISFLPPGFRSKKPSNMIAAIIGYSMFFYLSFGLTIDYKSIAQLYFERVYCLFMFLTVTAYSCNYLGIHKYIPPRKTSSHAKRNLSIMLIDMAIIFFEFFLLTIIERILF